MVHSVTLIKNLKTHLCWDDSHIQQLLEICPIEYQQKKFSNNFGFKEMEKLCLYLNIDMNTLFHDCHDLSKIDFTKIRKSLLTTSQSIPDKYLRGAGTYMEFVRVIFNFIRNMYNDKISIQILNNLGFSKDALLDDNVMVNSELLNDFMKSLTHELNMEENYIKELSFSGYHSEKRKKVMDLISNTDNDFEIINKLAKNSNSWEKNFEYTAERLNENTFIMKSKSAQFANDLAGKAELVTAQTIVYKKFIIAAIYPMLGRKMPKIVEVTNKIHKGRQEVNYLFKSC